jgi:modification target Cys-rich repeat protein
VRKLTLNPDELEVESFHLSSGTEHLRGTVKGAGDREPLTVFLGDTYTGTIACMSYYPCTLPDLPSGFLTCQNSCYGTCENTCGDTCGATCTG